MSALENYAHPTRYYHTFKHIGLMLAGLDEHYYSEHYRFDRKYMQLKQAIIYHDVVYDGRASNNEELSAYVAAQELGYHGSEWTDEVQRLILITKHHQPDPDDITGQIITDLDLAGLASHNYIRHSQQIRKEYYFADNDQWYHGRKAFLDSFLARPTIYHTETGLIRWEDEARRNMELELSYIEAKIAAL
jgi:predicted metal-dependent HD superfamily phosphohydrolase